MQYVVICEKCRRNNRVVSLEVLSFFAKPEEQQFIRTAREIEDANLPDTLGVALRFDADGCEKCSENRSLKFEVIRIKTKTSA